MRTRAKHKGFLLAATPAERPLSARSLGIVSAALAAVFESAICAPDTALFCGRQFDLA